MTSPITTINELAPRDQFTANGTQTTFSVDWAARRPEDVVVEFNSGDSPSIGYTFSPSSLNDDAGFDIIFNSAPPAGTIITVYRRGTLERQANYGQQKAFTAATVNAEFADYMLRLQELKRDLNRTLRLPTSDPAAQLVLPSRTTRASKYFTFDENGNPSVSGEADSGGGGNGSSSGDWGSDYGLVFDGATDQAEELQSVLTDAVAASRRVVRLLSNDGALVIGARVKVPAGVTLDTSQVEVHYIDDAELSIFGEYEELPESDLFRLAANAEPGDTTITVDASDYGSYTLLAADAFPVLRGENDANGNAIQRHEFRIVSTDDSGGISALVITIDPPIPDDQGTFTPINEGSAWTPGDTGIDRSLVTVRTASLLAGNVARGDISFSVADGSLFSAGSVAMLQDDRLASDPGTPDDGQPIRQEMVRIRSIATNVITLEQRVSRDFLTSENAVLIKVNAVKDAHLRLGKIKRIAASPASPASRKHGALMYFADRCSISGIDLDEDLHTYSLRGQAARATRSIDCRIFDCRRIGPKGTSSGDGNGIGNYYSTNTEIFGCYTERCRHGMTNQGSTRANRHDNMGVNNLINTLDDHGVYETDTWDHDNRCYGGSSLAADSTQQLGATYGNTRWHEGSHWAVSEGNLFVNFAGTSDGGLAIRPGTTDLIERNTYAECTVPMRVNADRRAPGKAIQRIVLSGVVLDDPTTGVSIDGRVQIWESEGTVAATAARPVYIDDSTGTYRYVTEDTGTLGTVNPTHTTGTETSGDIDLLYVGTVAAQAATIDGVTVLAYLDRAGTAVSQQQASNVTVGIQASDVVINTDESGATGDDVQTSIRDAGDRIVALEAGGGSIGTLSTANAAAKTSAFNLTASNASTYINGSTLNVGTIIPVDTSGGAVVATMVGTIDDLVGKTWLLNVIDNTNGCTVERPQTWEFSRSGDTTATSDIVQNIDISGILDGMAVAGTDDELPGGTTVADADYDTDQIQLSAAADETQASATLIFQAGEVGTINGIAGDATLRPGLNLVHCISADETTGVVVVTGAQTQAMEVDTLVTASRDATVADLYKIVPLGHASNAVDLTVTAAMDAAAPAGAWFVIFRTLAGPASAVGAGPPTVTPPTGYTGETAAGAMTTVWKYADGDWRLHGGLVAS